MGCGLLTTFCLAVISQLSFFCCRQFLLLHANEREWLIIDHLLPLKEERAQVPLTWGLVCRHSPGELILA